MTTTSTVENKAPIYPSSQLPKIWTLYYRYGNVPHLFKNFIMEGTMADAITRARSHCIIMNYRFICIRPFLVDLEEQEIRKSKSGEIEEDIR